MGRKRDLGSIGEDIACSYLKRHGYIIIAKNYTTPIGEIDIIAEDGDAIVFVEVKTRRSETFGFPEEAVNKKKMHKLTNVAYFFIKSANMLHRYVRFDIVAVIRPRAFGKTSVRLIKDAFHAID